MKTLLLPCACALALLAACGHAPEPVGDPAGEPAVASDDASNQPEEQPSADEPSEADEVELLHLWDELGQFRQDFWESKTHDERVHVLNVLSERGNEGASRALDEVRSGSMSSSKLASVGKQIANGGYGYMTYPTDFEHRRRSGPLEPPARIRLPRLKYPPEMIPSWERPSQALLKYAAEKGLPVVIYFCELLDGDEFIADEELAELSRSEAVFFKFQITSELEHPPGHEWSVVPASKLLSDDPSRDYGVGILRPRIIVADSWGNEFFRLTRKPTAEEMRGYFKRVHELAEETNDKLQKNLDLAFEHLAKKDRRGALKYMLKNFREGVVGMQAQEDTIQVYKDLLEEASHEMEELVSKGDKEGLQALGKEMRGSDLEDDIEAALEKLK